MAVETPSGRVPYDIQAKAKNSALEKILRKIFYKPTADQEYVISKQKIISAILITFIFSLQVNDFYLMDKIVDDQHTNKYLFAAGFFVFFYLMTYEADLRKAKRKNIPEKEIKLFAWRRFFWILGVFAAVPLIWLAFWFIILALSSIFGNGSSGFVGF